MHVDSTPNFFVEFDRNIRTVLTPLPNEGKMWEVAKRVATVAVALFVYLAAAFYYLFQSLTHSFKAAAPTAPDTAIPAGEAAPVRPTTPETQAPFQDLLDAIQAGQFDAILANMTPETVNRIIFVREERERVKEYLPATREQINQKVLKGTTLDLAVLSDHRHTTTLANIVATNELNFTPEQIELLLNKLIELNADFSLCDTSNYRGIRMYSAINNTPLQSLIALGASDPTNFNRDFHRYDAIIAKLIRHIITKPYAAEVFNHVDNFAFTHMSPIQFLIRQGKEELAELILDSGFAAIGIKEIMIAAESYGTNGEKSIHCMIKMIAFFEKNKIKITQAEAADLIKYLKYASPYSDHERLLGAIPKAYDDNAADLRSNGYFRRLTDKELEGTKQEVVEAALKEAFSQKQTQSNFSDYYRDENSNFFYNKFCYLSANPHLEGPLNTYIAFFELFKNA